MKPAIPPMAKRNTKINEIPHAHSMQMSNLCTLFVIYFIPDYFFKNAKNGGFDMN